MGGCNPAWQGAHVRGQQRRIWCHGRHGARKGPGRQQKVGSGEEKMQSLLCECSRHSKPEPAPTRLAIVRVLQKAVGHAVGAFGACPKTLRQNVRGACLGANVTWVACCSLVVAWLGRCCRQSAPRCSRSLGARASGRVAGTITPPEGSIEQRCPSQSRLVGADGPAP